MFNAKEEQRLAELLPWPSLTPHGIIDMMVKIGIAGAAGRMGKLLVAEVAATGCILSGGTGRADDPRGLFLASDVVIDFTHAHAAPVHAALAAELGRGLILGSSGLSPTEEAAVALAAQRAPIVYAANFATGVNLVIAMAEKLAAALPGAQYDAEILEMHHRQKVDAPSGTAVAIGRAVAQGRGTTLEEAGRESGRDGHTGARGTGSIGFAALRGGQVVGEHTLIFAAGSEHIALTHRSFDRGAYAVGAVRAAQWLHGRQPGLYSMRDVLGLA